jgi:hypothetical protein
VGVETAAPSDPLHALGERELTRMHEFASKAKDWPLVAKLAQGLDALERRKQASAPPKVASLADARKRRDEKGEGK